MEIEFVSACNDGDIQKVLRLISKGARNWNWGLIAACEGGHIDIVKIFLDKGATSYNSGMLIACQHGYLDIVKLLIDKGYTNGNRIIVEHGAMFACKNGHTNIVSYMLSLSLNDWNMGLLNACEEGQEEVVKLLLTSEYKKYFNLDDGLSIAYKNKHLNIVSLLLTKGANIDNEDIEFKLDDLEYLFRVLGKYDFGSYQECINDICIKLSILYKSTSSFFPYELTHLVAQY